MFECSGDSLMRLFSHEELANPATEEFKDISNMVRKYVKFFIFDQMKAQESDILDTLQPDEIVNSFVLKYDHSGNAISPKDAIKFLKSREACGLDEGDINLPTYEDRVAYFGASLMYHINEYKRANFKFDPMMLLKGIFHNFARNENLSNDEENKAFDLNHRLEVDKFRETLRKILFDPTIKKQFDIIRLHIPPDIDGFKVKPYPDEQHHRDGGDPDNTEETPPDEVISKDNETSNKQHHRAVGGDPDTAPEIPDAIGNVDKHTKKKNDYVDLYDGNSDVDNEDETSNKQHHRAVGGDPDTNPGVKSWWQQFLKEYPSINKSLTYMGSHPVATAGGATLVALGMYGAAKLWKKYKEKKKQQQVHNK